MQLQPVVSSNIASIGYEEEQQRLTVRFTSGSTYLYKGVPADVYDDFLHAASPGGFFSSNVKDVYPYERVG